MAIEFASGNPERKVRYVPRTAASAPWAWTVAPSPDAHDAFLADLETPGDSMVSMVRTVTAKGPAADAVADMWSRYDGLRKAVAENPGARWKTWAAGKLAMHEVVEAPATAKRQVLLTELANERQALKAQERRLHPVAAAMRNFMYGQVQLASLNGSTPETELLPPPTYVDPVEIVDMVAADLAQQQQPE